MIIFCIRMKIYHIRPNNRFGFIVRPEANKLEIKKEVEALYNVTVVDVLSLIHILHGTFLPSALKTDVIPIFFPNNPGISDVYKRQCNGCACESG